jgi:hypothetical protein
MDISEVLAARLAAGARTIGACRSCNSRDGP